MAEAARLEVASILRSSKTAGTLAAMALVALADVATSLAMAAHARQARPLATASLARAVLFPALALAAASAGAADDGEAGGDGDAGANAEKEEEERRHCTHGKGRSKQARVVPRRWFEMRPAGDKSDLVQAKGLRRVAKETLVLIASLLGSVMQLHIAVTFTGLGVLPEAVEVTAAVALVAFCFAEVQLVSEYAKRAVAAARAKRTLNERVIRSQQEASEGGGVVHGDKGARKEKPVTLYEYVKVLFRIALTAWRLLVAGIACVVALSLCQLAFPYITGTILDAALDGDKGVFYRRVTLMAVLSVAGGLLAGARRLLNGYASKTMSMRLCRNFFEAVIRQDMAYFDAVGTGTLVTLMNRELYMLLVPISKQLPNLLPTTVQFVGGFIMCITISWRLTLLCAFISQPVVMVSTMYAQWAGKIFRISNQLSGEQNEYSLELVRNVRSIKALGMTKTAMRMFHVNKLEKLDVDTAVAYHSFGTSVFGTYAITLSRLACILFGANMIMRGDFTVGTYVAFSWYFNDLQNQMMSVVGIAQNMYLNLAKSQRVMRVLENVPDIPMDVGKDAVAPMADIRFEDVTFAYAAGNADAPVLGPNFNATFRHREISALVGRSGEGKSTIVGLALRFYDPSSGRVCIGPDDLRDLRLSAWHAKVGVVSQDTHMFRSTIELNVAYGIENYTPAELKRACKLAEVDSFAMGFRDGYQTLVGENGVQLSGGQRQRIAIARLLLRSPAYMILDEATSALDAETEANVHSALLDIAEGRTVVLVAHRLATVRDAHQIFLLSGGLVRESGSHDELVGREDGLYRALVQKQLALKGTRSEDARNLTPDIVDDLHVD